MSKFNPAAAPPLTEWKLNMVEDGMSMSEGFLVEMIRQRKGEFAAGWPLYLDNRQLHGRAGFVLLMPLRLAGGDRSVLVERGWLPVDPHDRNRIVAPPVPAGTVHVEGRLRRAPSQALQLGEPATLHPGALVQNLEPRQLAQASGLALYPFVIEQSGDARDGLLRDWPQPSAGVDMHRGYAFQWYALAATAFVYFVVTVLRHARRPTVG